MLTLVHYCDVIMGTIASKITSLAIVYSTVYSGADQRKHQSTASLVFVWGIHRWPVNSPQKWPVTRKCFHLMTSSCLRRGPRRHGSWHTGYVAWFIVFLYHTYHIGLPTLSVRNEIFIKQSVKEPFPAKQLQYAFSPLTQWGRVTHICVCNLSIIGSDNRLSPGRHQAITCTNAGIMLTGPLWIKTWHFNLNLYIFIQENAFEYIVCEMAAIFSQLQCVKCRFRI